MSSTFRAEFDHVTRIIVTDVLVRRAAKRGGFAGYTPGPDITVRALWDTGATVSVISKSLVQQLGLLSSDLDWITGIGGTISTSFYDISVTLPNKVIFPLVNVAEWDGHRLCDMLIGMDIISRGNLSIANDTGKTVFSFKA